MCVCKSDCYRCDMHAAILVTEPSDIGGLTVVHNIDIFCSFLTWCHTVVLFVSLVVGCLMTHQHASVCLNVPEPD